MSKNIVSKPSTPVDEQRRLAKIANETEDFKKKSIDKQLCNDIIKARVAKGWKQKDLALRLQVHVSVVVAHENGTAIYNPNMIQKFKRVLGI